MTNPSEVGALEQRIRELEAEQDALRSQLARSELERWKERIDDLQVQIHLGTLELGDRVDPLMERLRNRWLDAKQQVDDGSSTAGDAFDAVRSGLDRAMSDLRAALLDAKAAVTK